MVRKLKYHEKKLLKKVDFISWKVDKNVREIQVLRRYRITKREDYSRSETYLIRVHRSCLCCIIVVTTNLLDR